MRANISDTQEQESFAFSYALDNDGFLVTNEVLNEKKIEVKMRQSLKARTIMFKFENEQFVPDAKAHFFSLINH